MPETEPKRGAFYARIAANHGHSESPTMRAARILSSIDLDQAADQGWVLTEYVIDVGTGLRIEPGLEALLNRAHHGLLGLVVVDRLASLARTAPLLGDILCRFSLAGTSLYAASDVPNRLVNYRAKIRAEVRLDGKFLLSTSDPDLSAEDVALGHKNLLEAERAFRDLKTTLELRPIWHRLERRIRAHVLLCWLALLLVRVAERQTGVTWRRIATELGRLQLVTLAGPAGRVQHTTALTPIQRELLAAAGIAPPPRVTSLQTR